jgi:hypothetical protein
MQIYVERLSTDNTRCNCDGLELLLRTAQNCSELYARRPEVTEQNDQRRLSTSKLQEANLEYSADVFDTFKAGTHLEI